METLFIVLAIVVLVAWIMSINLLIKNILNKGYSRDDVGVLWFVGIFASPIVLGLYVLSYTNDESKASVSSQVNNGLPKL